MRPGLDGGRVPRDCRPVDSAAKDVAGKGCGRLAWCRHADDEPETKVVGRSGAPSREHPPGRTLRRLAGIGGPRCQRPTQVRRRRRVGHLHRELLPGERGDHGDARRGGKSQVAGAHVERGRETPPVDVGRRHDRTHARGRIERRETRRQRTVRVAQTGSSPHRLLGGRRPRRHHDARSARRDLSRRVVHDGARIVRGGRTRAWNCDRRGPGRRMRQRPCSGIRQRRVPRRCERDSPRAECRAPPRVELRGPGGRIATHAEGFARALCHVDPGAVGKRPPRECADLARHGLERGLSFRDRGEHRLADTFHDAGCLGGRPHEHAQSQAAPPADRVRVGDAARVQPSLDERRQRHCGQGAPLRSDSLGRHRRRHGTPRVPLARHDRERRPPFAGRSHRTQVPRRRRSNRAPCGASSARSCEQSHSERDAPGDGSRVGRHWAGTRSAAERGASW